MATNTGLQGALLHLRWLQLGLVGPIIYLNHLCLNLDRSKTWNQRSLHHVSVACLPNKPLRVLAAKAPRVFHIGAWWAWIRNNWDHLFQRVAQQRKGGLPRGGSKNVGNSRKSGTGAFPREVISSTKCTISSSFFHQTIRDVTCEAFLPPHHHHPYCAMKSNATPPSPPIMCHAM